MPTTQIFERGNFDLKFCKILATGAYEEQTGAQVIQNINGMMELSIEFTQESEQLAADDNPDYSSFDSPTRGEGTLKLVNVPFTAYEKLFAVEKDTNSALIFGGAISTVPLGMTFKNTGSDGSINKFTLNKVYLTPPPLTTASIKQSDNTIRDFSIPIRVEPFFYTKADSSKGRVTYSLLNSLEHTTIWAAIKDIIYVPDKVVV
jgi:hypothetical protein